jgi:hypothetical protein
VSGRADKPFAGLEPPTSSEHVRATLRGIRRTLVPPRPRKAPVLAEAARGGPFRSRRSQASATTRCSCWASQARFAAPSSWRSTLPT